jgi:mannan endo-1,4-beta-mannosidase
MAPAFTPYNSQIAINIANEWGGADAAWQSAYVSAVGSLRTAGYTCPIVIDTANDGEDFNAITGGYAAAVLAADTLQNCVFSYHLYNTTIPSRP